MAPERRTLALVLTGLLLIGMAAFTAWFLTNFERRTREVPIGAAAAARRNPMLAAERFLTRLGIAVESSAGRGLLRQLPPVTDTLVVNGLGPLSTERQAALRTWLQDGGRLVVEAVDLWDDAGDAEASSDDATPAAAPDPDDLPGAFGIRLRETKEKSDEGARDDLDQVLTKAVWMPGSEPLSVAFHPDWYLDAAGVAGATEIIAGERTRMVRLPVGAGMLTVSSDHLFLTNDRIGRHDHALFLAYLVEPAPGGKVWLLYDSAVPWLGTLLWTAAPAGISAAAILVLVWVWSLGARLGPLEQAPNRRRRDLIEHLDAAGAFLWRHGRAAGLVEATRRQVFAVWQRRRPDLHPLAQHDQIAGIAAASGLLPQQVSAALTTQADDAHDFIEQTKVLKALWHGARPRRP
ncbi:DUF4350 domain-containing protein [uncultured Lamprocystis sp.]|jgi:hypothetical protein|uniref:DUF4350 domain-containing protein n=1 Tax=uncultured Lamprocystis sp. TaxID=543132 RepID=UPI0025D29540|nr:DUF4350 domain-containing protein [uncultured Lamprocystis sp.]